MPTRNIVITEDGAVPDRYALPLGDTSLTLNITLEGVDLIGVGFTDRGVYDPATAYVVDDVVLFENVLWVCITDNTGIEPGTGTAWDQHAQAVYEIESVYSNELTVTGELTNIITTAPSAVVEIVLDTPVYFPQQGSYKNRLTVTRQGEDEIFPAGTYQELIADVGGGSSGVLNQTIDDLSQLATDVDADVAAAEQAATDAQLSADDAAASAASISPGDPDGVATLNASSLVVQDPASKGLAGGLASLDASSLVLQDPASKGLAGGVGSLDADGFAEQRPLTVVQNPTELRGLSGKSGASAQMIERGNDTFTWQSSGTDDDYETFTSNTGGVWVRNQRTKVITPTMVGAVGDGIADDRPALQYMFGEASARNYQVDLEGRTWRIFSPNSTHPDYGLILTHGLRLRNGRIQGDGATYLVGDPDPAPNDTWILEDVTFDGRNVADTLINVSNGYAPYIRLSRCVFLRTTNMGFNIQTFVADIQGCRVSEAQVGFRINQCTSLNVFNNYAQGCTIGYETGSIRYSNWAANGADFCHTGYDFGTAKAITFQGGCEKCNQPMIVRNTDGLVITTFHMFRAGTTDAEEPGFPLSPPAHFLNILDRDPVVIGEIALDSPDNNPTVSVVGVNPGGHVTYQGSTLRREDFDLKDGSASVVLTKDLSDTASQNLVPNGDLLVYPGSGQPPGTIITTPGEVNVSKDADTGFMHVESTGGFSNFFDVNLSGLAPLLAGREIRAGFEWSGHADNAQSTYPDNARAVLEWNPGTGHENVFPGSDASYHGSGGDPRDETIRTYEVRGIMPENLDSSLRWRIRANGQTVAIIHTLFKRFWISIGARPAYGSDRPIEHTVELDQTIGATPTQAEVQAISDKVDELLLKLETSQKMLTE